MKRYFYTTIIALGLPIVAQAKIAEESPSPQVQLLMQNTTMLKNLCNLSLDNGEQIKNQACNLQTTIIEHLKDIGWCENIQSNQKDQWQPCKVDKQSSSTPDNWKIVTNNHNTSIVNNDPKANYKIIIERANSNQIMITIFLKEQHDFIVLNKDNKMMKFYLEPNKDSTEYKYTYKTNNITIYDLLSAPQPTSLIIGDNRLSFSLEVPYDILETFKDKIAQEPVRSINEIISNNNKFDKPTGSNALGKQAVQQLGDGMCRNDINGLTDVVATCFIQYNQKAADLDLCILEDLYTDLATLHAYNNFSMAITGEPSIYGNSFLSREARAARTKLYYYKKFKNQDEIESYFDPDLNYIKTNIDNYIHENCRK